MLDEQDLQRELDDLEIERRMLKKKHRRVKIQKGDHDIFKKDG